MWNDTGPSLRAVAPTLVRDSLGGIETSSIDKHDPYYFRLEVEMRMIDPSLSLPYWDSTLDSHLPNPADSVMWTDELMGRADSNGWLVTGAFAGWRTSDNLTLNRRVGADRESRLYLQSDLVYLMRQTTVDKFLAFTADQCRPDFTELEYTHDQIHKFVGGHMGEPTLSANDPLFYLHHSFTDFIWELWRQQRQTREDRQYKYPEDNATCTTWHHFRHGNEPYLRNYYTDNLFEYAPRPFCSEENPSCGSRFFFCDRSHGPWRCASKVRLGGNCAGFMAGEDVCYGGQCRCGNVFGGPLLCRCIDDTNDGQAELTEEYLVARLIRNMAALEEVYRQLPTHPEHYEPLREEFQRLLPVLTDIQKTPSIISKFPMLTIRIQRYVAMVDALKRYEANRG